MYRVLFRENGYILFVWNACSQAILKEDLSFFYCIVDSHSISTSGYSSDKDIPFEYEYMSNKEESNEEDSQNSDHDRKKINIHFDFLLKSHGFYLKKTKKSF